MRALESDLFGYAVVVEDDTLAPQAERRFDQAPSSTVVTLVLSGSVQIDVAPDSVRVLGAGMSLTHASFEQRSVRMVNLAASRARVVRVMLSTASGDSLTLGNLRVDVDDVAVRVRSNFMSDEVRRPAIVLVLEGEFTNEGRGSIAAGRCFHVDGRLGQLVILEGEGRLLTVEALT